MAARAAPRPVRGCSPAMVLLCLINATWHLVGLGAHISYKHNG
jgi:hypothetical protein